jgi:hypothetical protein
MTVSTLESTLPKNLQEVLAGNQAGYRLGMMYVLVLDHGLMGTFPAIFKGTSDPVITADLEVLKKVWALLKPRKAKIVDQLAYINDGLGVSVRFPSYHGEPFESCVAASILTPAQFEELVAKDPKPFEWAPGLFGGDDKVTDDFIQLLEGLAYHFTP